MEIILEDDKKCAIFTSIMQNLKQLSDSVNITLDEEKFYIQGMDSSHISMFELSIQKDWFTTYTVNETISIGANLIILSKILSTRSEKQHIKLTYNTDNMDKLGVDFIGKDDDYNKFFEFPLMDIDSEMLGVPDTVYDLNLTIDSKKFKQLVDQLNTFGDSVSFNTNGDKLNVETDGEMTTMKMEISKNEDIKQLDIDNDVSISFNTRFIHHICGFHKIASNVYIGLSNNTPVEMKYVLEDESFMRVFLAPKMDES